MIGSFFSTKLCIIGITALVGFIIQRCCCYYYSCSTTIMSCMVLFCFLCVHLFLAQDPFFCLAFWSYKSLQQLGKTFRESKLCICSLPPPKLSLDNWIMWFYMYLYVVCIIVLSHSLHPCVSSMFKFHNCGNFLNFIISVNLFFATIILGSNLNFYPFWNDIFVQKAMELEGLFIIHFWCVGFFTDDMLMKEKIWNIVL